MTIRCLTLIPAVVLSVSPILVPAVLAQQSPRAGNASGDAAEIRAYRLTIEDVRKWFAAGKEFAKLEATNPELGEGPEDPTDSKSLTGMQQHLERIPEARRVLEANGLTARKAALITVAYAQAAMLSFAEQQGVKVNAKDAADVNPANRAFVRQHEAELKRLQEELDAIKKDVP